MTFADKAHAIDWLDRALHRLLGCPRSVKRWMQVSADAVLLAASFLLAMFLRLESWGAALNVEAWTAFAVTLPLTLIGFALMGLYRAIIRYFSARMLWRLWIGVLASATGLLLVSQVAGLFVPRSVPFIYAVLSFCAIASLRFIVRELYRAHLRGPRDRVLIYGAGEPGRQLLHSLAHGLQHVPVAFVDDDPALVGTIVGGMKVFPAERIEALVRSQEVDVILLALPDATQAQRARILRGLEALPVHVQTIPAVPDLISGKAKVSELREVSIEDLLGRDPVPPLDTLLDANLRGKVVLVSGAGGSIGSELARQILSRAPRMILLLDVSEYALYQVDQSLRDLARSTGLAPNIVPLLGSVMDRDRVATVMRRFGVQTVFHAAAYKHVPLVESNMIEGVRNNVFGTVALVEAAIEAGVESFTLISTDKAVRPTNVMGASKRMAELVCQAQAIGGAGTVFSMVRFGNVLGSSGSVIPLFRRQIENGGPVTVTHPDITRYFMTIPEAAQLVIQAGAMADSGDIFVLDMGQPVRIVDLAKRMIRLSGLRPAVEDPITGEIPPGGDIAVSFTRLRPGEKLFEELLIESASKPTQHARIFCATEPGLSPAELAPHLAALDAAIRKGDPAALRRALETAPVHYSPGSAIVDLTAGPVDRPRGPDLQVMP